MSADEDTGLKALVNSGAKAVNIVGKSWDRQVTQVLETSLENNLSVIRDSMAFLKAKGVTVF